MTDRLSMTPRALSKYRGDPEAKPGPALAALPDRWQKFVLAKAQSDCSNVEAARLAGFVGDRDTLKATGWKLMHDPRVQAALHEEVVKLLRDNAVMAVGVLEEIARDKTTAPKDRIKAAAELLSRSGFAARSEHKVIVERQLSEQAVLEDIARLAAELGVDPVKLIGGPTAEAPPPVEPVDAEFTEVAPAPIPDELRDIL